MRVLVFGATGLVGQGVLQESLRAPDVDRVTAVGRSPVGVQHPRLRDLQVTDLTRLEGHEAELRGFDACFYCLGVPSGGMSEADYTRITYDLALAIATPLARFNPGMTFVFVSGLGTDATEQGRSMWARVKGRTENALKRLPFRAVYLFRPGFIQPPPGYRARTTSYRVLFAVMRPVWPLLRVLLPRQMATPASIGRAMLAVARMGSPKQVLEPVDIHALAIEETALS